MDREHAKSLYVNISMKYPAARSRERVAALRDEINQHPVLLYEFMELLTDDRLLGELATIANRAHGIRGAVLKAPTISRERIRGEITSDLFQAGLFE